VASGTGLVKAIWLVGATPEAGIVCTVVTGLDTLQFCAICTTLCCTTSGADTAHAGELIGTLNLHAANAGAEAMIVKVMLVAMSLLNIRFSILQ
jgi:hypothetical protein